MDVIIKLRDRFLDLRNDQSFRNDGRILINGIRNFAFALFRLAIVVGVSYVILGPLIGIIANSFFSNADNYNPLVYLIPQEPTLERYKLAFARMDYFKVLGNMLIYDFSLMLIQVVVCSLVGYGFARFDFPFKKLLFACVIIMIVIPAHSIMLPLYVTFQNFNPLGIVGLFNGGKGINLLSTPIPMYIMTLFGCGLRSGLFIYIFNQFFRGLPKEIEEAAFVDGASTLYTYFRIMLVNAIPSVLTVAIFAIVWQYNDTFYSNLFLINQDIIIGKRLMSLQATIANADQISDPAITRLYLYAGIVLAILPIVSVYVILQRRFIEGVERSGIVG